MGSRRGTGGAGASAGAEFAIGKGDQSRRTVLDAAIGSFAEFGWNGTNMSTVARRSGMTRGKIQYYFPTLDALRHAAVIHLHDVWQERFFAMVSSLGSGPGRFDAGIDALCAMLDDPLHLAKLELEACARTNGDLMAMLEEAARLHEEHALPEMRVTFHELAGASEADVRLARHFAMAFLGGLSTYRFGGDALAWRNRMIAMLRQSLVAFWQARGIDGLGSAPDPAAPASVSEMAELDARRTRALALIEEAAALLAG